MINFIANILMILTGTAMYTCGELYKKELKYLMGIPIGLLVCITHGWMIMLACWLTYFIACEFGYGDKNPLTKILGKRGAITFCGTALGLASFPLLGWWALLSGLISGVAFFTLSILDDADRVKEPWVAIFRSLFALGGILFI